MKEPTCRLTFKAFPSLRLSQCYLKIPKEKVKLVLDSPVLDSSQILLNLREL